MISRPDSLLLDEFMATLGRSDDMTIYPAEGSAVGVLPPEMVAGASDDLGSASITWKPARIPTGAEALDDIYRVLPAPLPPLYERLVLSYRWLRVEVSPGLLLMGNPPGPTLAPLLHELTYDAALTSALLPRGFVQFARRGGYDPVCFNTGRRLPDGDCPVVSFDHEAVLCHGEVRAAEVAPTFRALVLHVIG